MMKLLISRAEQVVQVVAAGERHLVGASACNSIAVQLHSSVVVNSLGLIEAVGPGDEIDRLISEKGWTFECTVDGAGCCVLPGFVDAHTHPVWAGDRCHEFMMKLRGATYLEVQQAGGGIGYTTRCTREASEDELLASLLKRLDRMVKFGTTTIEGKSGYGLEPASELKMLRVLKRASDAHAIDIVSTFCGAHAVPAGLTSEEATVNVINEQLPQVLAERAQGLNNVENIDVFCEKGVFSREESRRILLAGKTTGGLRINFHGDELTPTLSGELAGEIGASAVSHLEHVTDEGIRAMAAVPTYAVLLPATAYVLRIAPPPARKLMDGGVPVALGSDFCPNAHSMSMPHTMNLACVLMHMTVEEALVAATINAAASIGRSAECGSIEEGKLGDLVIARCPRWEHIVYQMVDPPIEAVFKRGVLCYSAPQLLNTVVVEQMTV
jgi:imidazolonepropionase